MKSLFQIIIIYILFFPILSIAQGHSHLTKILLKGKTLQDLNKTGLAFDHGRYIEGESFIGDFSHEEIEKLKSFGFKTQAYTDKLLNDRSPDQGCFERPDSIPYFDTPGNYFTGSLNGFPNLQELYENLDLMTELYPNLISSRKKIANFATEEGRSIFYMVLSDHPNDNEGEPQVLYTALHHAREPASMSQMLFFMWYLLENYNHNPEIKKLVDSRQLVFVPCVNPDGYFYNQTTNPSGFGYWRKNRSRNQIGYGVDLNRNYGFQWGYNDIGSSNNGESENYRGESAFSEPETQAIRQLCLNNNFKIALNYHSFGNILIIPWGYNDSKTKDDQQYAALAKEFTKYNSFTVGTALSTLNYQVNGVSDDWMYGEVNSKNKIFSLTPEVGESFWPDRSEISEINQSTQHMNFAAAWNAGSVATFEEVSSKNLEPNSGSLKLLVKRTGLENKDIVIHCTSNFEQSIQLINPATFQLSETEERIIEIPYTIVGSLPQGASIDFQITLETGEYTFHRNIEKKYLFTPYWKDEALHLEYWKSSINNPLVLTNESYTSAPYCYTDSPNGKRYNNQTYSMTTAERIDLTNATYAYLSYQLKYDLQPDEDFAQILVSTDNLFFEPLCGRYSVKGNFLQGIDQPVYTGTQKNWVADWIDLKNYVGKEIFLQIKMGTGSTGSLDGFYIDDIKLYADLISGNKNTNAEQLRVYPQPSNERFFVKANLGEIKKLSLINALGEEVPTSYTSDSETITISTHNFPKGVYQLLINDSRGQRRAKVIIE